MINLYLSYWSCLQHAITKVSRLKIFKFGTSGHKVNFGTSGHEVNFGTSSHEVNFGTSGHKDNFGTSGHNVNLAHQVTLLIWHIRLQG